MIGEERRSEGGRRGCGVVLGVGAAGVEWGGDLGLWDVFFLALLLLAHGVSHRLLQGKAGISIRGLNELAWGR